MAPLIIGLALVQAVYGFEAGTKQFYDVEFSFDGFIPVLGGIEGQAKARLGIEVRGQLPDKAAPRKASYELKQFALFIGEDEFPYSIEKIKPFFPKSNVWFSEFGRVLNTDAPKLDIPVRLPGIDPKRFADVSFLPVEFATPSIEQGQTWTYKKAFGDSMVNYEVAAKSVSESAVDLTLKLKQTYEVLEDEAKNVVLSEKDAVAKVKTEVNGTGNAVYDVKKRVFSIVEITADSISQAIDLKTSEKTVRKLKLTTRVKLRDKPF